MSLSDVFIRKIAAEFWAGTVFSQPPYDVTSAVSLDKMEVIVLRLPDLSLKVIGAWLEKMGISGIFGEHSLEERKLHGFVFNRNGGALIFVNRCDPEPEQRFTIAHEVSHYLLDHKLHRDRTIRSQGDRILEVLDGHRGATMAEKVTSLLHEVEIFPNSHLIEKDGSGSFEKWANFNAENDADRLALEMLAPAKKITAELEPEAKRLSYAKVREIFMETLVEKYGLPNEIAGQYAARLSFSVTGGPSVLDGLGF